MPKDPSIFESATIEDVYENPAKFGAPTFAEYLRDREKYEVRKDHLLAIADNGSKLEGLKAQIGKVRWEIDGIRMDNPEQIENYCKNEGLDLKSDIDIRPFLIEGTSGKIDLVNRYVRKFGGLTSASD